MRLCADTSFLFSYYASDAHSQRADQWRQSRAFPLLISIFNRLELGNALELAAFQKRLSQKESSDIWLTVESDLTAGILTLVDVPWTALIADSESLVSMHTSSVGCRTLDVMHVAFARMITVDEFASFDQRQIALANRIGLKAAVL